MDKKQTFKWTVEIEVDEKWVADGYDLDDIRATAMVLSDLVFAEEHEVKAKVISAPNPEDIAKAQGYRNAEEMHQAHS